MMPSFIHWQKITFVISADTSRVLRWPMLSSPEGCHSYSHTPAEFLKQLQLVLLFQELRPVNNGLRFTAVPSHSLAEGELPKHSFEGRGIPNRLNYRKASTPRGDTFFTQNSMGILQSEKFFCIFETRQIKGISFNLI